jgi:hypothetical protein
MLCAMYIQYILDKLIRLLGAARGDHTQRLHAISYQQRAAFRAYVCAPKVLPPLPAARVCVFVCVFVCVCVYV